MCIRDSYRDVYSCMYDWCGKRVQSRLPVRIAKVDRISGLLNKLVGIDTPARVTTVLFS